MQDVTSGADVERLVAEFYRRVLEDPIIGFLFTEVARIDLAEHLPRISAFWKWQLLAIPGYAGRTFEAHIHLHQQAALTEHHFHRWLYLFSATVDELFAGPAAAGAKLRAAAIATSMQHALENRHTARHWVDEEARGVQLFTPE